MSVTYFIRSFYGHSYQFLPSANETEVYRQKLIETYKEYEDGESLTEKYFTENIFKYFNECSSANTKVNDLRSEMLHKCNTFLILCSLPLVGTFLLFTFAGIDKNSIDKEYKVKITTPIIIESKANEISNTLKSKENINGQRATETSTTSATTSQEGNKGRRTNPASITTQTTKKINGE